MSDAAQGVWITGVGLVTPLGIDRHETWAAMCDGTTGIHAARGFDPTDLETQFAGEVPEAFEARYKERFRLPYPDRFGRFTKFALLAASEAIADSGIEVKTEDPMRVGVSIGVGAGQFYYMDAVNKDLIQKGDGLLPAMDHNYVVRNMTNAPAAQISIWLGINGPSTAVSLACASGAQAIAIAADWIRHGRADVVLAGACDATVNRFVIRAYNAIRALSTRNESPETASRPFDGTRDGFVMAEGGAVLVLESERHAKKRGAARYAALIGQSSTSEAYNVVSPRPKGVGMAAAMQLALRDAGVDSDRIDYVSAHGTSTPLNDAAETAAMKAVFGDRAFRIPISSQKSMIGHSIGATSAIEAAVTALSLRNGVITPTINYREADPQCDLDYVPNEAREAKIGVALSNAFGFGGHNCCLVMAA